MLQVFDILLRICADKRHRPAPFPPIPTYEPLTFDLPTRLQGTLHHEFPLPPLPVQPLPAVQTKDFFPGPNEMVARAVPVSTARASHRGRAGDRLLHVN